MKGLRDKKKKIEDKKDKTELIHLTDVMIRILFIYTQCGIYLQSGENQNVSA